jgi:hypothetical protein
MLMHAHPLLPDFPLFESRYRLSLLLFFVCLLRVDFTLFEI